MFLPKLTAMLCCFFLPRVHLFLTFQEGLGGWGQGGCNEVGGGGEGGGCDTVS